MAQRIKKRMRQDQELTRDPVCNMQLETGGKYRSTIDGQTFYFCSPQDKAEFDRHPDFYASHAQRIGKVRLH